MWGNVCGMMEGKTAYKEVLVEKRFRNRLLGKIIFFLFAFFLAFSGQLVISGMQETLVIQPENLRIQNIQAISRFLDFFEESLSHLADFRWEYGDAAVLAETIDRDQVEAQRLVDAIDLDLSRQGEAQYLYGNAMRTTFATFCRFETMLCTYIHANNSVAASNLYYGKIVSCGNYIRKYTQQLLERAISDNQDEFVTLMALNSQLKNLQNLMLCFCLLLAFLMVVSIVRLLLFFRTLSLQSRSISKGDFSIADLPQIGDDEISGLSAVFNTMKHSMKQQVRLLEEKNRIERNLYRKENEALGLQNMLEQARLQQFRSQINPHFLFNTLNIIKISAEDEGAPKASKMLSSLGRIYSYAMGSNAQMVPLSQELQVVQALFSLYKERFGDRVSLVWRAGEDIVVSEVFVPSFILQPLAENAFRHGIAPKDEGGTVSITISKTKPEKDMLRIIVSDDGVGMEESELQLVREKLGREYLADEHIGIYNVAARLQLLDKRSSFEMFSIKNQGTQVVMTLPYREDAHAENPDS